MQTLVINQMIQFFLIMALGYMLFKLHFTNADFNKKLSAILLNFTLPALILHSVLTLENRPAAGDVINVFIISTVMYIVLPVLGYILSRIFPVTIDKKGVYAFMTAYGNVGFMGFPIIGALYGSTAVFYTAIFNILFNLSCYTLGTVVMTKGMKENEGFQLKHLVSPGFIISLTSIVIYFINPNVPDVLTDTIGTLGSVTTPLAMILIGSTLATNELHEIFADKFAYVYAILKQIALPLAAYPILPLVIKDSLLQNVTFIMLLMPVANSSVMFANAYGADEKLAARIVFLSTIISIVTIPVGVGIFL